MICRVETRIFVIKLENESLRYPGDGWREDIRNIGGEPSDGVENDNAIRVTFEDDPSSDAEIETALMIIVDRWRAKGWVVKPVQCSVPD